MRHERKSRRLPLRRHLLPALCAALLATTGSLAHAAGARPLVLGDRLPVPVGLVEPRDVHVTADGAFLYARGDDAVAAYAWEPSGPRIVGLQVLRNGEAGVSGLAQSWDLVFSPDDAHAYVSGNLEDSVAVLSRDAGTGLLSFVEVQTDGMAGVSGMRSPTHLAMSQDGSHLYVATWVDRSIVVFERNPASGALSFVETESLPSSAPASSVVVSPEDNHVYVTSEAADRIYVFTRDAATGELDLASELSTPNRAGILVSPNGAHAYAWGDSWATLYLRDPVSGALDFQKNIEHSSGQDDMIVSPDGTAVLSARFGDITTFTRDDVTGDLTRVANHNLDVQGDLALSPDGAWVFQATHGLGVHSISPGLHILHVGRHRAPGSGFRTFAAAISPDGQHLYAAMATGVLVYDRNPSDGSAVLAETLFDGFDGVVGIDRGRDVTLSPDGGHVYVARSRATGPLAHPAGVAVFSRDPNTGRLAHVETESAGPGGGDPFDAPRLRVSPDGAHLYAVGYQGQNLCRFDRDPVTGALTFIEEVATFNVDPAFVLTSPGGAFVYASGSRAGVPYDDLATALHVYARNGGSGALTEVDTTNVPNFAQGAALSPNGAHLYVSSSLDGDGSHKPLYRLLAYARDPGTGALALIDEERSRKDGVQLDEPLEVVVSFDGTHVYVASDRPTPGIASFVRNASTGTTAFVERIDGVELPILTSPFDEHLYARATDTPLPDSFDAFSLGFQCSEAPMAGCRSPSKATLQIIDDAVKNKRDRIKFTWQGDTASTHPELDPAGKHYAVCVYDSRTVAGTLVAGALMPADQVCGSSGKPCWTDKTKRITYKDPNRTPEGVSQLTLQPSDTKPQIKAKLQGTDLGWRVAAPLPPSLPVVVQLQGESGPCWEASFSAAIKNDGRQFRSVALP